MSDTNGNGTNDHDANGRFVQGNKKAKGRPRRDGKRYAAILNKALTPRRWRAIVERAIEDATQGDEKVVHHARNFLAKYGMGEPEHVLRLTHGFDEAVHEREREAAKALISDPNRLAGLLAALEPNQLTRGAGGTQTNGNGAHA